MGRGRGKGKKLNASNHDDTGSGEEEKIPAQKRRGRPQKPLKDDVDDEEHEKMDEDDMENGKDSTISKESKSPENGKKRKRNTQVQVVKEKSDSVKEESVNGTRSSTDDSSIKTNGFRHIGSRRKNKPRRAAEAIVECK